MIIETEYTLGCVDLAWIIEVIQRLNLSQSTVV